MTQAELLRNVTAFGETPMSPTHPESWRELLDLNRVGTGRPHDYTEWHFRVLVAWSILTRLLGPAHWAQSDLRRDAAWELADHETGWVVITEQTVNWTRHPTPRIFDRGAVCIPVPSW